MEEYSNNSLATGLIRPSSSPLGAGHKAREMCEFHTTEVSFLGFVVAQGRLQPDPIMNWAVEEWPRRRQLHDSWGLLISTEGSFVTTAESQCL